MCIRDSTSTDANSYFADAVQNMTGVNVISPTWFSVTDNSGNISSLASGEYVMQAHEKGLKVWGLVDNFNENMSTTEVLSKTSSRQNLENQLITYALKAGLDGINVDFESLSEGVGIHFLQFLSCLLYTSVFSFTIESIITGKETIHTMRCGNNIIQPRERVQAYKLYRTLSRLL